RRSASGRAGPGNPRGHHRAALGQADFRGTRAAPGLLADHRPSTLPGRARPAACEARIPMEANNPDHEIVDPELSALEQRLAAWRPASGALDRDQMLYDAGRAAAHAENRLQSWRLATAALLVISIGLGGLSVYQRSLRLLDRDLLAQEQSPRHALQTALPAPNT